MGMIYRPTEARLRTILSRQQPPKFGAAYEPAIRATREEAPSKSRFLEVWFTLHGRYISTLSVPERMVLIIIQYCPWLIDLHEQWMLPYLPAPHPLSGHPMAGGLSLPDLRGTVEVTAELGGLEFHPTVPITRFVDGEQLIENAPFPWIGDFLLFLKDDQGPYCNNISVKQDEDAFDTPQVGIKPSTNIARGQAKQRVRHRTEQILTKEVGIPTVEATAQELNEVVVANLQQIHGWTKRRHPLGPDAKEEILDSFRAGLIAQIPALEVIHHLAASKGYSVEHIKTVMYQAIWHRQLRIDLHRYFFTDHPMMPERVDVLSEFAHWFKRY